MASYPSSGTPSAAYAAAASVAFAALSSGPSSQPSYPSSIPDAYGGYYNAAQYAQVSATSDEGFEEYGGFEDAPVAMDMSYYGYNPYAPQAEAVSTTPAPSTSSDASIPAVTSTSEPTLPGLSADVLASLPLSTSESTLPPPSSTELVPPSTPLPPSHSTPTPASSTTMDDSSALSASAAIDDDGNGLDLSLTVDEGGEMYGDVSHTPGQTVRPRRVYTNQRVMYELPIPDMEEIPNIRYKRLKQRRTGAAGPNGRPALKHQRSIFEELQVPIPDDIALLPPERESIFGIPLEAYTSRGWEYPDIDIAEYFNYGLKPSTWTRYAATQVRIRDEFERIASVRQVSQPLLIQNSNNTHRNVGGVDSFEYLR